MIKPLQVKEYQLVLILLKPLKSFQHTKILHNCQQSRAKGMLAKKIKQNQIKNQMKSFLSSRQTMTEHILGAVL